MKQTTDDLIEMITVRLYNIGDAHVVHEMLKQIAAKVHQPASPSRFFRLCKSEQVENDWAIYLHHPTTEKKGTTDLAISLAEMLRHIGLVNHTIWKPWDL